MIFLSILKIIGIVLACVVGFVLLLVLLVLFAPIQYKIHSEGENADTIVTGSAKWLLGLATIKLAFLNFTFGYKIKAAGIKIKMGKFPEEKTGETKTGEVRTEESDETRVSVSAVKKSDERKEPTPAKDELPEIEYIDMDSSKKKEKRKKSKKDSGGETEKVPFMEKVNALKEKYEKAKALLESDVTKKATKFIKIQIFNILNHIKPKKITGKLNFGLEDPSNTAIIYGLIGSVTEIVSNNKLIVTPEFYQKGVNSDLSISGSIFVGYVVLCFLRLILDKNVKSLFKAVRRIV